MSTVKAECTTCGSVVETSIDETPGWLIELLTEASGLVHGNGNADSMRRIILSVPEQYVRDAGLRWAVVDFDDSDD